MTWFISADPQSGLTGTMTSNVVTQLPGVEVIVAVLACGSDRRVHLAQQPVHRYRPLLGRIIGVLLNHSQQLA